MSNVVAYGQTFLDLVLHTASYIKMNMRASYEPPDPRHQQFAKAVMNLSLAKRLRGGDKDSKARIKLLNLMDRFLLMFNGDWKDWTPQGLVHHCSVTCKCRDIGTSDLGECAAALFVELALCSRPPVPALSRWLKCAETAKWYLFLGSYIVSC